MQVSEYEAPLVKLTAEDCIGTPNVLIVTETASVIRQFGEICSRRGWNCCASDQNRPDMDYDYWNPLNRKTRGVGSMGHALPQSEVLSHIGWHSVLNLVVSRRGSALVGSIQSQWAMATLGMMRRYHGRAVTLCSILAIRLADGAFLRPQRRCVLWRELQTDVSCVHSVRQP